MSMSTDPPFTASSCSGESCALVVGFVGEACGGDCGMGVADVEVVVECVAILLFRLWVDGGPCD